jgi:hypothetical protein
VKLRCVGGERATRYPAYVYSLAPMKGATSSRRRPRNLVTRWEIERDTESKGSETRWAGFCGFADDGRHGKWSHHEIGFLQQPAGNYDFRLDVGYTQTL